jgi:hypothetical protein
MGGLAVVEVDLSLGGTTAEFCEAGGLALSGLGGSGFARRCGAGDEERGPATGTSTSCSSASCSRLTGAAVVVEFDPLLGGTTVEFCEAGGGTGGVVFAPGNPGKSIPSPFKADPTSTIRINTVQLMLTWSS